MVGWSSVTSTKAHSPMPPRRRSRTGALQTRMRTGARNHRGGARARSSSAKCRSAVDRSTAQALGSGSFERPVVFPGWTLPGVVTLQGASHLLEQGASLGGRIILAGFGLPVATAAASLKDHGLTPIVLDPVLQ